MFEQLLKALTEWSKKKPTKITMVTTPIYENGFVNRPANCCEISFTNIGNVAAFVNKRPLFFGGFLTVGMNEGETDTTPYEIQFDPSNFPNRRAEVAVIFKIVNL